MNENNRPPKLAEKLLCFFIAENDRDCICGDLAEAFETRMLPKFGATRAKLWYWKEALLCICHLAARGRMRSSLPMILIGAGIGIAVFLLSWSKNVKHGLTIFPDGFTFLVLFALTFLAVWFLTRKIDRCQRSVVRRVAFKISATVGIFFGAGIVGLSLARFPLWGRFARGPFGGLDLFSLLVFLFMFLISWASALICGLIASSFLLFMPSFREGLKGNSKRK